jgi:hypothetical protein
MLKKNLTRSTCYSVSYIVHNTMAMATDSTSAHAGDKKFMLFFSAESCMVLELNTQHRAVASALLITFQDFF